MLKTFVAALVVLLAVPCMAWDGYDYDKGNFVEIDKGNLVRRGETIEVYDYGDGQYKDMEVRGIERGPGSVDVEVYDPEADEVRTFEMEDK